MRLLPLCTPDASQASNSSCPAGWPLPQDIAQRAMQVLGESVPYLPHAILCHSLLQVFHALAYTGC